MIDLLNINTQDPLSELRDDFEKFKEKSNLLKDSMECAILNLQKRLDDLEKNAPFNINNYLSSDQKKQYIASLIEDCKSRIAAKE